MPGKTGNVLIIDDDEGILTTLKILLRRHFAEVVVAHTPHKITALLAQQCFQVVLLDMNFSTGATNGKEGFQWLAHIKAQSPEAQVILMTAYGDIDLAIRAMKEGATDFIIKPWDNDKLLDTVLNAFKQSPLLATDVEAPASETVNRIFMFLDIRSSTAIAEELGHMRYFSLLNDFFSDISAPISEYEGEIYQYVGDQVVINWPLEKGLAECRCLYCFFAIKERIQELSRGYLDKYGLSPTFKAGLHFGEVSTGTVGTIKKETVYSGDVLNTTARLESLCNRYRVDLLLSKALLDRLPLAPGFIAQELDMIHLRGRHAPITICSVSEPARQPA